MPLLHAGGSRYLSVSILVFVELALDGKTLEEISDILYEFQSLFSWNLLLMGGIGNVLSHCQLVVSILVFVELALDVVAVAVPG